MDNEVNTLAGKKIVCLGGGIGTVNLIKGLKQYTKQLTVVTSMADEGGSAGRLRRLYQIHPPGDIVSCIAVLSENGHADFARLLTYRFPGDRYGKDHDIAGHKLGNLMMVAARDLTGSFEGAIDVMKRLFQVQGDIYPATADPVSIKALTVEGKEVIGEEAIDLGKYDGERVLDRVMLTPMDAKAPAAVLSAIDEADILIAGPGDLYTTVLPVLIVPEIKERVLHSTKPKLFIVNVANKPFETKGYTVADFLTAITKHMGAMPFTKVLSNTNTRIPIPSEYHYTYVAHGDVSTYRETEFISADVVDESFPLYHDFSKLAKYVAKAI
jgi:uncharacterized cofD-like protein